MRPERPRTSPSTPLPCGRTGPGDSTPSASTPPLLPPVSTGRPCPSSPRRTRLGSSPSSARPPGSPSSRPPSTAVTSSSTWPNGPATGSASPDICDLADEWLSTDVVVQLETGRRDGRAGDVIRLHRAGQRRVISAVEDEALYSTRAMLAVEEPVINAYDRGRHTGVGVVPRETVDAILEKRPELGQDQIDMVRSITGSGHGIQCILGRAAPARPGAWKRRARPGSQPAIRSRRRRRGYSG